MHVATSLQPLPHLVLIHGAWQGAWAWDALLPLLEQQGLVTHALNLPGNGHDDDIAAESVSLQLYVNFVCSIVAKIPHDATVYLVGHSGGGQVATVAADHLTTKDPGSNSDERRLAGIVYIAGMAFPNGQSFVQVQEGLSKGVSPHVILNSEGTATTVPIDVAKKYFYNDCPDEVASAAVAKLTPQPVGGRSTQPYHVSKAFWTVPKLYVETTNDQSVVLQAQRIMQSYLHSNEHDTLKVISLDTGHAPQLSAPHLVRQAIVEFVASTTEVASSYRMRAVSRAMLNFD